MIVVYNKHTHVLCPHDVYVGRPSILGNPYSAPALGRTEAIQRYKQHLADALNQALVSRDGKEIRRLIRRLAMQVVRGEKLHLVCWCAPEPCHADVLKSAIQAEVDRLRGAG